VAHGINARVEPLQALVLHPPAHRMLRETQLAQLAHGHNAVLPSGKGGQGGVRGVRSPWVAICATVDYHTRIVARSGALGCCRSLQDAHAAAKPQTPRPSNAAIASAAEG
jgi:hypothetical protein